MATTLRRFVIIALLAFQVGCTIGFTSRSDNTIGRSVTTMNAWSLELPQNIGKGTWYTVDNPTARRRIYNDAPEFRFATAGSDWPDLEEEAEKSEEPKPPQNRRINPIRRAAQWIRRRRR